MTRIPANVIDAYYLAHYQAESEDGPIILRVGQYSEPLSQLLSKSDHRSAAFITACNPLGARRTPEENRVASEHLRERLNRYVTSADDILEGIGFDPHEDWPGEESFLVLGLALEAARMLGEEFQQNAIVWADSDAIPRLILLR